MKNLHSISLPAVLALCTAVPAQGQYTEKTPMPEDRAAMCTALVDGKIYVIGGIEDESANLSVVEVYDPVTDSWETKSPMPILRGVAECAVVDGKIYVIGGANSGGILSNVEVYDPATDTWDSVSPLPAATCDIAVESVNGKIYVIGGSKRTSSPWSGLGIVREYDPATDTWTIKSNMPSMRWSLGTCVIDGKIYAIGGNKYYPVISSAVEVYDPAMDSWTSKTDMPTSRYSLSTCYLNGKIYAFGGWKASGGENGDPMYKILEVYDVETDTWTREADMPINLALMSTETINGKIYIFGGTNRQHTFESVNTVLEFDPEFFEITSIDTTDLPSSISVTSSADGIIYLVPADTEKDLDQIRMVCLDSTVAEKNISFIWSLDSMDNGTYWLYATDVNGNISDPVPFTVSGVGIVERRIDDIRIYPNPTNTILTIETGISTRYSIEITSLNGKLLFSRKVEGTTHQFDLSTFKSGIYFITLRSKDMVVTRKIVKL